MIPVYLNFEKAYNIKSMFRSSPLKMLPEISYLHRYLLIVRRNYFLDFFEDLYGRHIVRVMRFLLESLL